MSRYFTQDHEWVDVDGDIGTVGISEYAQSQLGDVVFVDVPEAGKTLSKGDEAAVVESVKAASDVYSPVSGTVIEGNAALADDSSLVNSDAEAAVVESVKAASDVYSPVSGTVIEGNAALADTPGLVNEEPEGDGWFFKLTLTDPDELNSLMDEIAYAAFVAKL